MAHNTTRFTGKRAIGLQDKSLNVKETRKMRERGKEREISSQLRHVFRLCYKRTSWARVIPVASHFFNATATKHCPFFQSNIDIHFA